LAQTYTNYEIVVVDDGSTDDSANVAEAVLRECTVYGVECKGKVIRKANGGVSSARNEGILAAKGEYIAFLDGDDLWHPEYLETLHQLIVDYPDASLYGIGCTTINGDKIPEDVTPTTLRGEVENVWNNYPGYWTGSSSSSSRARLLEIGLFDTRMTHGEDIDMWWRLLLSGKGVFDNRVLAYYRQDTENRAMNKLIPLEKHIPYFVDKYAEARANNVDFRRYFDREIIYRLYPYMFDAHYRKEAKRIAKQMDYSLQKWTMKFRMVCPRMYRMYEKLKKK
jgi:glycosyltransferase involved in cell wall biosynthesis